MKHGLFCHGGELRDGVTNQMVERNGNIMIGKNVPAQICERSNAD